MTKKRRSSEPVSLDRHRAARAMPPAAVLVPKLESGEGIQIDVPPEDKDAIAAARKRIREASKLAGIDVQTVYSRSHHAVLGLVKYPPEVEEQRHELIMEERREKIRRMRIRAVDDEEQG